MTADVLTGLPAAMAGRTGSCSRTGPAGPTSTCTATTTDCCSSCGPRRLPGASLLGRGDGPTVDRLVAEVVRTARRGALDERPADVVPRSRGARRARSRAVLDLGLAEQRHGPADRRRRGPGRTARPGARRRCHPRVPRGVEPRDVGGPAGARRGRLVGRARRLELRRRRRRHRSRRDRRPDVLAPARARGAGRGARQRASGRPSRPWPPARVSTTAPPGSASASTPRTTRPAGSITGWATGPRSRCRRSRRSRRTAHRRDHQGGAASSPA